MTLHIAANERHMIHVFALQAVADPAAFSIPTQNADGAVVWPLKAALGATNLDPEHTESFPTSDLSELGVAGYLSQGYGIDEADLDPIKTAFPNDAGHVVLIFSQAFGGVAQTLVTTDPLRYVSSVSEPQANHQAAALISDAAQPSQGKPGRKKPSDAAMSGRIATLALLTLFGLVAVMVWIAS